MAHSIAENETLTLDPHSKEGRIALAKMVTKLFDLWNLSSSDKAALLGLSESSRSAVSRYGRGEPLADNRDLFDRVTHILSIHRSLRILFPKNRDIVYTWMTTPNRQFDSHTPVQVIREQGFLGLLTVKRYLDFERGR